MSLIVKSYELKELIYKFITTDNSNKLRSIYIPCNAVTSVACVTLFDQLFCYRGGHTVLRIVCFVILRLVLVLLFYFIFVFTYLFIYNF